jgi:hypothetical protein
MRPETKEEILKELEGSELTKSEKKTLKRVIITILTLFAIAIGIILAFRFIIFSPANIPANLITGTASDTSHTDKLIATYKTIIVIRGERPAPILVEVRGYPGSEKTGMPFVQEYLIHTGCFVSVPNTVFEKITKEVGDMITRMDARPAYDTSKSLVWKNAKAVN